MSRTPIFLIAGLLLGSLVGYSVATWGPGKANTSQSLARPEASVGGSLDGSSSAALAEIRSTLEGIDSRLAGLEGLVQTRDFGATDQRSPADAPTGTTVATDPVAVAALQELAASVRALEALMEEQSEDAQERHATRLQAAREAKPESDWTTLQEILDAWAVSEVAGREKVLLRSDIAVLERYGPPGLVYPVQDGVHWVYGQNYDPQTESYALQVVMRVQNQVITGLWVEGL